MALPDEVVERSYLEQAQLAQVHRWLAAACAPPGTAEPLDALFAPGARLHWLDAALPLAVEQLPALGSAELIEVETPEFLDAHSVRLPVTRVPARVAGADAGDTLDGTLTFSFTVEPALLPQLTTVVFADGPSGAWVPEEQSVHPIHPVSRILGLKHRWHALVEDPQRSAAPFAELISADFVMDWGDGSVRGEAELADWVTSSASAVSAARHDLVSFDWAALDDGAYRAQFGLEWSGRSRSGKPMAARSEHRWRIRERPGHRYAAIERMDVELVVPFHLLSP